MEEAGISALPFDNKTKTHAMILATGMAIGTLPKTIYKIISSKGLDDIIFWYKVSNVGVTNYPDTHKH